MLLSSFLAEFKKRPGAFITPSIILFRKPCEVYDLDNNVVIARGNKKNRFDDSILDTVINGHTIREYIAAMEHIPILAIEGGNGSSSDSWTGGFGHAPGGGGGKAEPDFPARFNQRVKNPEDTLQKFRERHVNDAFESGVAVDERGFVTRYIHGGATSVPIAGTKGEIVYHNHPGEKGGNFSDSDLLSVSTTGARGIVASGKEGDYKFVKTDKFNANAFVKAVRRAKLSGKDYTDAADKWLKAHQKRYGYKYSFTPAK